LKAIKDKREATLNTALSASESAHEEIEKKPVEIKKLQTQLTIYQGYQPQARYKILELVERMMTHHKLLIKTQALRALRSAAAALSTKTTTVV
jgi:hypothetical protein